MTSQRICPYCAETIRAEAIKCRYCGSRLERRARWRTWTRSSDERVVAGVCGGLAQEFDLPVTLLRLVFVVGFLFSFGSAMVVYVVLWLLMPLDDPMPLLGEQEFDEPREGSY